MDREESKLTASEIVDRFSIGYYEILIAEARDELYKLGRSDGKPMSDAEIQRERTQLYKAIKSYEQKIADIKEAIDSLNRGLSTLEEEAKKDSLRYLMHTVLRNCFCKYEPKKNPEDKSVRIPSETYDALFEHPLFKHASSKFQRIYSKESRSGDKITSKVKKDIYKKLKKVQYHNMVDMSEEYLYGYRRKYRPSHPSKNRYDYTTLSNAATKNVYSLDNFVNKLYSDFTVNYRTWELESYRPLNVEIGKIEMAYAISDKKDDYKNKYAEILESMEYLSSHYSVHKRFKTFYILKDKIKDVEQLTREVKCLDLIIDAFDNTALRDSEVLAELNNIYRKQNSKLMSLTAQVDEMYKKTGMKEFIEAEQRLVQLNDKSGVLRYDLHRYEQEGMSSFHPEVQEANDLYSANRAEMIGILIKYPELNKPEYGIDLSKYDKKGRYIGKEQRKEAKRETPKESTYEEEVVVPTRVVTTEELERENSSDPRKTTSETTRAEEVVVDENDFEIPDHLTTHRTFHYQAYMAQKMRGSGEISRLTFSEYLEKYAPHLEELIEIEQRREKRADNVFKLYIKYLATVEDKSTAMRFSDFAQYRHGLSQNDLPDGYSDDEIKRRVLS